MIIFMHLSAILRKLLILNR